MVPRPSLSRSNPANFTYCFACTKRIRANEPSARIITAKGRVVRIHAPDRVIYKARSGDLIEAIRHMDCREVALERLEDERPVVV